MFLGTNYYFNIVNISGLPYIATFVYGDGVTNNTTATYTFNTYEGATHAFSNPDATSTGKKFSMPIEYNEAADKKSWNDMKQFFTVIF